MSTYLILEGQILGRLSAARVAVVGTPSPTLGSSFCTPVVVPPLAALNRRQPANERTTRIQGRPGLQRRRTASVLSTTIVRAASFTQGHDLDSRLPSMENPELIIPTIFPKSPQATTTILPSSLPRPLFSTLQPELVPRLLGARLLPLVQCRCGKQNPGLQPAVRVAEAPVTLSLNDVHLLACHFEALSQKSWYTSP